MPDFILRFPVSELKHWASLYSYPNEALACEQIGPRTRQRGYFTREDFLALCRWKTPRSQKRCEENDELLIREVTSIALSSHSERLRIEVLTLLSGVSWPTASVLLHFGSNNPYPILDFRALWSLGVTIPKNAYTFYNFDLWWEYTTFCRQLANQCGATMRDLDRALWQYSKENQPGKETELALE